MLKQSMQTGNSENLFIPRCKQVMVSFASSIKAIADETMRQNYASLVLDRFLVLFFLQQHGLLDNNIRYLQHHLDMMHTARADTFFTAFFLPLCHTTLSGQTASGTSPPAFGHIPTLAHPLFQKHPVEASCQPQIPDESLYELCLFLEEFCWELIPTTQVGASPIRSACPVVHHDIFAALLEQRINQKQTGTYYTTDDVTGYVANNTILPTLFHRLQKRCPAVMDSWSVIWRMHQASPDRYIPEALQHSAYLPKETRQEYQLRQQRFTSLLTLLQQGTIRTIDALITYNLDFLRLAVDVISTHQDLGLLVALFTELEQLTILDPTCGSGAFLYSALATLQTLYMACLQRMQALWDRHTEEGRHKAQPLREHGEATLSTTGVKDSLARVDAVLQQISAAPNMSFFVVHHIIAHNLYGLDLMDEAIRVCTLRFYLTLLAQIQRIEDVPPLYQIPMHIKTGNALVGDVYSTVFPEVTQSGGFAVILGNPPYIEYSKVRGQYAINGYEEKSCGNLYAAMLERSLTLLHPDVSYIGLLLPMSICGGQRFGQLRALLAQSLSLMWLANFDIFPCRLFGNAFQRLSILLGKHEAQPLPEDDTQECGHEVLSLRTGLYTTRIHRWYPEERPFIIDLLRYTPCCLPHTSLPQLSVFPKIASLLHAEILQKIVTRSNGYTIATALQDHKTPYFVYYQEATNYWIKAVCHIPFYKKNGRMMTPPHGRLLFFDDERTARVIMALMNSSLFYLWFTTYSDGFHLAHSVVTSFPCGQELLEGSWESGVGASRVGLVPAPTSLFYMAGVLEADLLTHTRLSTRNTRRTGENRPQDRHAIELTEYQVSYSKEIIDEIDRLLADYYDFTKGELDFVVGYDEKYRRRQVKCNNTR